VASIFRREYMRALPDQQTQVPALRPGPGSGLAHRPGSSRAPAVTYLLIGDRLDITGARWGLENAEAILTLRAAACRITTCACRSLSAATSGLAR
jgi:hypothetical protein